MQSNHEGRAGASTESTRLRARRGAAMGGAHAPSARFINLAGPGTDPSPDLAPIGTDLAAIWYQSGPSLNCTHC
jgi:hypothetical protein